MSIEEIIRESDQTERWASKIRAMVIDTQRPVRVVLQQGLFWGIWSVRAVGNVLWLRDYSEEVVAEVPARYIIQVDPYGETIGETQRYNVTEGKFAGA